MCIFHDTGNLGKLIKKQFVSTSVWTASYFPSEFQDLSKMHYQLIKVQPQGLFRAQSNSRIHTAYGEEG